MTVPLGHRAPLPDGGRAGAAVAQGLRRRCWPSGCCGRRGVRAIAMARRRRPRRARGRHGAGVRPRRASRPGSAVRQLVLATRRQGWRGLVGRANGGMVVHIGVAIIAVAIATNGHYAHEVEARYEPGQTRVVSGHEITYLSTEVVQERNREATKVRVRVDGGQVYEPALSRYSGFGSLIGTPSVRPGLLEDVYLTVTRLPDEGSEAVTLRVIIQPMALWLWVGGGVMALGTVLAAWPGRHRRRPTDPVSAPDPARGRPRAGAGGRAMTATAVTTADQPEPTAARAPPSWRRS